MILETTAALLGALVLYHVYRNLRWGQDFIGDFARALLGMVRSPLGGVHGSDSLLRWIHPAATGVAQRQVGTGAAAISTTYTVVGPKMNGGVGLNEWTPPLGAPAGLPAIGSPTDPNALPLPPSAAQAPDPDAPFELLASND
jgi:hypothetical protein